MENIWNLEVKKNQLLTLMQMMDSDASFDTEEGRMYGHILVKLVMIEMQIETLEKAAHI